MVAAERRSVDERVKKIIELKNKVLNQGRRVRQENQDFCLYIFLYLLVFLILKLNVYFIFSVGLRRW